jgi:predicted DNA-binding antitoxin AbrB/MazE fold protein
MTKRVEAIHENGVLHPLEPLPLAESERVTVTIGIGADRPKHSHLDVEFIERARRELASVECIPTHEEVCQMPSNTERGATLEP